jgi:hypothetical protein
MLCLQALCSIPALRDAYVQPTNGAQLKKGPIGSAMEELIQTIYGAIDAECCFSIHAAQLAPSNITSSILPAVMPEE